MGKASLATLVLLAACADSIPAPHKIPTPTPLRALVSGEETRREPWNGTIEQSPGLVIQGYLQSPEAQSGVISPTELPRCGEPKDYNVRARIDFAQDAYRVGEPVEGKAVVVFMGQLNPMVLIETSRAGHGSGIQGYAIELDPLPEWGLLEAFLYGMSRDGSGYYFSGGVPTFAEPGVYDYAVHVFDCDCIREQLGVPDCLLPFESSDFDRLSDYFSATEIYHQSLIETVPSLAFDSETIIGE